jgi:hypothetical protein
MKVPRLCLLVLLVKGDRREGREFESGEGREMISGRRREVERDHTEYVYNFECLKPMLV